MKSSQSTKNLDDKRKFGQYWNKSGQQDEIWRVKEKSGQSEENLDSQIKISTFKRSRQSKLNLANRIFIFKKKYD